MKKDLWNANLYDQQHAFVSEFGGDIIEILAPKSSEKILDIGCGTGDLANQLTERGVEVIGIDQSENMIDQANAKYPHIDFRVADILQMNFDRDFDAVFSNATLHWVKQPEVAISNIYSALKPDGRFVAEFGGKGNIHLIADQLKKQFNISEDSELFPWYFPTIGEYSSLMENAGFRVVFAQHFDRPTPLEGEDGLRKWIEMFASHLFNQTSEKEKDQILVNIESNLKEQMYIDGKWIADYKRIRVIGIKETSR
ncbi:Ubiquinone/menaquinone biosynthesis C-methylase UbiE [Gracilibacillus ureilyticus]|uniref:Ubiquinone/menaquinone biosynthesis C-methylase UbiE n=1 Tax=Gracilibacillus ureilyticus TaxID=531814 RepID=A0A1H9QBH7_9BACI|nr:class I SAM-dependent methyltransferase [Gracilibacillus ureilyticus]SER57787.1 Ubiquinone/menaquinone biosynthesis C-methylase UbiE [Gracilibacillus ureilyticus]